MDKVVSVIIPVYNGEKIVGDCLESVFNSDYKNFEVIVVDDNSNDNSLSIASEFPCDVIKMDKNVGAAAARNAGAQASCGEILFFLDSDIKVEKDTLTQIAETFENKPEISAFFCSYQKDTAPTNFFSLYKNLVHHHTHQTSFEEAATFCGGFGAIKRKIFFQFNGFNESYRTLEDMELGYRLYQAGHKIYLNKKIQLTHCKEYTFRSLIKSDLKNRAIPWTQLMLEKKIFRSDLNTKVNNIWSVIIAFLLLFNIPLLFFFPKSRIAFVLIIILLLVLNHNFYSFVFKEKGLLFTFKVIGMNWFTYYYAGLGFIIGFIMYLKKSKPHTEQLKEKNIKPIAIQFLEK